MNRLLERIRAVLKPKPKQYVPPRQWIAPPEVNLLRIAEVKPGDTLIVSLPRIEVMDQAESDKIEKAVRDELKMPEGVNVAVFFGQVEIFHLRKV